MKNLESSVKNYFKLKDEINNNFKNLIRKYSELNNDLENNYIIIGGKFGIGDLIGDREILLNCSDCMYDENDIILIEEYLEDNGYILIS